MVSHCVLLPVHRQDLKAATLLWIKAGFATGTVKNYRITNERLLHTARVRGMVDYRRFTPRGIYKAAQHYARVRGIKSAPIHASFRTSFRALAWSLEKLGRKVARPEPRRIEPKSRAPEGLQDFLRHCQQRGRSPRTLKLYEFYVRAFHAFLQRRRFPTRVPRLRDIDSYFVDAAHHWMPHTVGHAAGVVRMWMRFLYSSGRTPTDLAAAVSIPRCARIERPPKSVPWAMIRQLARGIDRSTAIGRRDYAQYLLFCAYGFGASEIISLKLNDIDWERGTLQVLRQKTGNTMVLPLLPAAGRAIAAYLQHGRPPSKTRYVFPSHLLPFGRCVDSGALRSRLVRWARHAKVELPNPGTHVFRHSHATRHLECGASLKMIGDILGHRSARTTSVYVRSAQSRLRRMSLPAPQ